MNQELNNILTDQVKTILKIQVTKYEGVQIEMRIVQFWFIGRYFLILKLLILHIIYFWKVLD